jgi:hypothetical protein
MQGSGDDWLEKRFGNMIIDSIKGKLKGTWKAVEVKANLSTILKPIGGLLFRGLNKKVATYRGPLCQSALPP